ncbi:hypothetical protein CIW83_02710 [Tissierella sp. P1]|uniref:UvrD-helicase domain-containing protein n=1 Tax=Tissierella sp. P1 TaxID=1280483 RepID=UPI000BA09AD2|nr:UvrD-helicase domain-containing protein [Tissierella sp. P1]OZV13473.1 hypothetical protein CIW83_02710 [Tissierella sp. P1]
MHANKIIVTDDDIKFTENILLDKGQKFDESRRKYIRDFDTLDLMAVPGSGKTTLLLAKLLILERNLPFSDNSGILVLSHTNTAVEEIKDKIKLFSHRLFNYPNFVGTIQSFVNKYLALPYYEDIYIKKIQSIDEKKYYEAIEKYYNNIKNYTFKSWLINQYDPIEKLKKIRLNENDSLINYVNGKEEEFQLKDKKSNSYIELQKMKKDLLKLGILHYDDAYYLASRYINKNPLIINIIQNRFRYVFVDEMQDMDIHQNNLLEKIFYNYEKEISSLQRLGDINQAIYSNEIHTDNIWKNKKSMHIINGSNRLTKLNAELASRFSIDNNQINGLNNINKNYKPILLVYDKNKVRCYVIQAFSRYVTELFRKDYTTNSIVYKVVSWRRYHEHEDKITLSSYCPNYSYMDQIDNNHHNSVGIITDFYELTKILTKKIIDKLNEAGIKINNNHITKFELINYLKDIDNGEYDKYKLFLYKSINLLFANNYVEFYKQFNAYLKDLIKLLTNKNYSIESTFIDEEGIKLYIKKDANDRKCRMCDIMGVTPIITTVHSVKGETHDVTLFLESFYNSKYESDILHEVICGKTIGEVLQEDYDKIKQLKQEIEDLKDRGKTRGIKTREDKIKSIELAINYKKQYSKLVYVALTRAKSIIGYGISKDKYNEYLEDNINKGEWEIIFV